VGDLGAFVDVCLTLNPLDDLIAVDVDIAYDASVLDATSVAKTGVLPSDWALTYNIADAGWVKISLFSLGPSTGDGCAVNITFETLQPGCSLLEITKAELNEGEVPSTSVSGVLTVHDLTDQDGDGVSESAGDCSDRFDWIHPGAAELCNGADDDCDGTIDEGVTCPCGTYVSPRVAPFWERVCRGASLEDDILPAYVDAVNDYATFSGVIDADDVCDIILPGTPDSCADAEEEFMALLLNLASDRLCVEQPIDAASTSSLDVYEAVGEIDTLLANPSRSTEDCEGAADIASEISGGQAIEEFLAEASVIHAGVQYTPDGLEPDAVVFGWLEPDAAAAGRPMAYQVYRSAPAPLSWMLVGETACASWFPDFSAPGLPDPPRWYQVIGIQP